MLDSEGLTLPHQLTNAPVAAISANDTRRAGRMPARPTPFAVSDDHKLSFWLALVRTRALALADQAVVSGTNFLTTIMIARWALPDELGIYAMAISLLVSWIAAQEALVLLPYTIHRHRPQATPTEHAGSYLALSGLFSVVAIAMFSMAALGLSTASAPHGLVAATLVLAVAVPFASLREFGRRLALAHLRVQGALVLDLATSTLQLGGLAWLAWTGRLSATTACAAIGVAYAVSSVAWLYLSRESFAIQVGQLRKTMRRSWLLGKWLLATRIAESLHAQAVYWLLAVAIGTAATAAYAACMSIVSLGNPIILGLFNILLPQASLALANGGVNHLQRTVIRDTLLLGAAMALFCLLVAFGGERAMHLLFHGPYYQGQGHTLLVLALALLPSALGMPAANALAAIERPYGIFWASLTAMVVTVVLAWFFMLKWGLVGAAYGLLAGNAVGTLGRWAAFLWLAQRVNPQAASNAVASLTSPTPTSTGDPGRSNYRERLRPWATTPFWVHLARR
jgi:O-antigen/teichoic acid export membrane protein